MKNKIYILIICFLLPICIIICFDTDKKLLPKENLTENNNVKIRLTETDEIVSMSIEEYVVGIVAAEMPASFEIEALKAQAVAARSYALANKNNNDLYDYDDTTADQAFITKNKMKEKWKENFEKYYSKIKNAVNDTEGLVIKYQDKIISAFYFSMSNGYTEKAASVFSEDLPYLNIVESKWDTNNENFTYVKTINKNEFCKQLNIECINININNINKNKSNRVIDLSINNKKISGIEFRNIFSLRSTDFEITQDNESIVIQTKGYGHGVGMSQHGANGMAKEGKTYIDILNYYYQDIKIKKI